MVKKEQTLEIKPVYATAKYLRISPSKVRRVANVVRGKHVRDAFDILRALPQSGADYIEKALKSAIANATHNDGKNADELYIAELLVNEGPRLKRFRARARGRVGSIIKRTSHIIIGVKSFKEKK